MVNGNYVLYGDRPSSESEIVDDHVQTRTAERKNRRKTNRTANDLQRTLNMAQLDNETDSVKFEKKIKEPRLLRYVSTMDVEENYVNEKFETYDLKPTEEPPRRYAFQKKPKNPADGSVNYAYSRSSSSCSSPNGNLATISEHGEQYGTYRVRSAPSPSVEDIINGYETKVHPVRDTYFKTKEGKSFCGKGSHIDSLHRVPNSAIGEDRMARVLRVLRWPVALVAVCIALAVFVYFLVPDNLDRGLVGNSSYWETIAAGVGHGKPQKTQVHGQKDTSKDNLLPRHLGTKTAEIDFYDADNEKIDFTSIIDPLKETGVEKTKIVQPVFPKHVDLEVQYGNEKADTDTFRTGKLLEQSNTLPQDSTLKPHITQKPERPLEVYFKETNEESTTTADYINRAETINEFTNYGDKQPPRVGSKAYGYFNDPALKVKPLNVKQYLITEPAINTVTHYNSPSKVNFTSGHSNLFGISIEDAEKMRSTTQSSVYNTRVSPTLPTWRDGDDATTKKYPVNVNNDGKPHKTRMHAIPPPLLSQCRSTHLAMCRGVLPYDLAGPSVLVNHVEVTRFLPQIEYLVSTNCSNRARQFFCALLEPECSPPPYTTKMPCEILCKAILDGCEDYITQDLGPLMRCNRYRKDNCIESRVPCHAREMSCSDMTCIPRDWICDGNKDCPEGEDEQTCTQCEKTEFRCSSGICIHKRWLCDGFSDCPSGDDEEGCAKQTEDRLDPGEEPAGSAPAPAIRRPGKVAANVARSGAPRRTGENDSKELLITSDSTNALKRNFTRRPSPSRLSPYSRTSVSQTVSQKKPFVPENPARKTDSKLKSDGSTVVPIQKPEHNDSQEDVNIDDLGFLGDSKKESVIKSEEVKKTDEPKPKIRHWAATTAVAPTRLDKTLNKMERVINGAALLKAAEEESYSPETNATNFEDEQPIISQPDPKESQGGKQSSAHASPCPSGELRCVDGRCITLSQLCDGNIDCTDHADEDNCYT